MLKVMNYLHSKLAMIFEVTLVRSCLRVTQKWFFLGLSSEILLAKF